MAAWPEFREERGSDRFRNHPIPIVPIPASPASLRNGRFRETLGEVMIVRDFPAQRLAKTACRTGFS